MTESLACLFEKKNSLKFIAVKCKNSSLYENAVYIVTMLCCAPNTWEFIKLAAISAYNCTKKKTPSAHKNEVMKKHDDSER